MYNDKNLTILLTLKNRSMYTYRWMDYANKIQFPFKVFIADGGTDAQLTKVLSEKNNFRNINYKYKHYPNDSTNADYYSRLADSLTNIHTPFTAIAANDDFYLIESLRQAIQFLNVHSDYSACGGDVIDFHVLPGTNYQNESSQGAYGKVSLPGKKYAAQHLTEESPFQRLENYMLGNFNLVLFFAVHRTECLKKSKQILSALSPGELTSANQLTCYLTIAQGKIHRLKSVTALHQGNPQVSFGRDTVQQFPTPHHWIQRQGWLADYLNIVKAVGSIIADQYQCSLETACNKFNQIRLSALGEQFIRMYYPQFRPFDSSAEPELVEWIKKSNEFNNIVRFLEMKSCDCIDHSSELKRFSSTDLAQKALKFNQLGEDYFKKGDLENAFSYFNKAIETDPNCVIAHNNMGVYYWNEGKRNKALHSFIKALSIDSEDQNTTKNIVMIYVHLGLHTDAIEICQSFLKKYPNNKEFIEILNELQR